MNHKLRGDWGEAQTAQWLSKHGYAVLASQYRCRFGEIDLVAKKGEVLCFVEVKTRAGTACGLPREAVDTHKQQRIRAAAGSYLARYALDCPVRFDVAEVYYDEARPEADGRICYLENAFS